MNSPILPTGTETSCFNVNLFGYHSIEHALNQFEGFVAKIARLVLFLNDAANVRLDTLVVPQQVFNRSVNIVEEVLIGDFFLQLLGKFGELPRVRLL